MFIHVAYCVRCMTGCTLGNDSAVYISVMQTACAIVTFKDKIEDRFIPILFLMFFVKLICVYLFYRNVLCVRILILSSVNYLP